MAGEEQSDVNRRDDEEPAGPGTPEGNVLWDTLKDLLACPGVVEGEDPQEFERHRRELLEELAPVGPAETALAERIASLFWRLQRAAYVQNAVFDHLLAEETSNPLAKLVHSLLAEGVDLMGDDPDTDPNLAVGRMVIKDFSGDRILDRLLICEQQIESSLFNATAELRRLQAAREP